MFFLAFLLAVWPIVINSVVCLKSIRNRRRVAQVVFSLGGEGGRWSAKKGMPGAACSVFSLSNRWWYSKILSLRTFLNMYVYHPEIQLSIPEDALHIVLQCFTGAAVQSSSARFQANAAVACPACYKAPRFEAGKHLSPPGVPHFGAALPPPSTSGLPCPSCSWDHNFPAELPKYLSPAPLGLNGSCSFEKGHETVGTVFTSEMRCDDLGVTLQVLNLAVQKLARASPLAEPPWCGWSPKRWVQFSPKPWSGCTATLDHRGPTTKQRHMISQFTCDHHNPSHIKPTYLVSSYIIQRLGDTRKLSGFWQEQRRLESVPGLGPLQQKHSWIAMGGRPTKLFQVSFLQVTFIDPLLFAWILVGIVHGFGRALWIGVGPNVVHRCFHRGSAQIS